jgi:hypothetical protein
MKTYSAPRRFDLATVFVVTTAYALLLGGLKAAGAWTAISVVIAGAVTCIGISQALLFSGRRPRLASILTGTVIAACLIYVGWLYLPRHIPPYYLLATIVVLMLFGVLSGYLAGGVVGGVFLVADVLRGGTQPTIKPDESSKAASDSPGQDEE